MDEVVQLSKSQKINSIPVDSVHLEVWNLLRKNGHLQTLKKKQFIFKESEEIKSIYILVSGYIKLYNKNETLDIIEPGESIGAGLVSFNNKKSYYPISAVTLTDVELIKIDLLKVEVLIENNIELTKYFFTQFKNRMLFMQTLRKIRNLPVKNRVAFFLIQKKHLLTHSFCTRKLISEIISSTTESVIRTLSLLSREGLVSLDNKSLQINNQIEVSKLIEF